MASLAHKVAIIRRLELFDGDEDDAEDLAMYGLLSDIEALTGQAQS